MNALRKLNETGIPFLVGGAFAFSHYSNVPRGTKDIDVFVRQADCPRVLEAFAQAGYRTEMPFPHAGRVLLSHLILFGFVYPDTRQNTPRGSPTRWYGG